jgi:hypothetical protein
MSNVRFMTVEHAEQSNTTSQMASVKIVGSIIFKFATLLHFQHMRLMKIRTSLADTSFSSMSRALIAAMQ